MGGGLKIDCLDELVELVRLTRCVFGAELSMNLLMRIFRDDCRQRAMQPGYPCGLRIDTMSDG